MSESPRPVVRRLSPWWLLLLAPLPLLLGWIIPNLPHPEPRTPASVTPADGSRAPAPGRDAARAPTAAPVRDRDGVVPPAPGGGEPWSEPARSGDDMRLSGNGGLRWAAPEEAITESKRTGKPILLDFNAEWCGPCRALKQAVFDDPSHARAVQAAVVPVSVVDRNREDGANPPDIEALQRKFEVRAFPTLVVYSPGTGRFTKQVGFAGASETEAWIVQAAEDVR